MPYPCERLRMSLSKKPVGQDATLSVYSGNPQKLLRNLSIILIRRKIKGLHDQSIIHGREVCGIEILQI
jgi:hypothetical protein